MRSPPHANWSHERPRRGRHSAGHGGDDKHEAHAGEQPAEGRSTANAPLLIVAHSGRALATSAARAGIETVVLDLFADADTRRVARSVQRVAGADGLHFEAGNLLSAAAEITGNGSACAGLVAGSGFEEEPYLLARLTSGAGRRRARHLRYLRAGRRDSGPGLHLFGNGAETMAAVKDPNRFFAALDEAGIDHPAVRLDQPEQPAAWLAKRIGGCGGFHVRAAADWNFEQPGLWYFQRFEPGQCCSAVFLADGHQARLVGLNRQLRGAPGSPFAYAGVVGAWPFPSAVRERVEEWLNALTVRFGLVGLNGIDFVLHRGQVRVLELNPRPPASFELYDEDFPSGLLAAHMAACEGRLPEQIPPQRVCRGRAVVFAPRSVACPSHLPAWCVDRPEGVRTVRAAEPVCTVCAEAATPRQVLTQLETRRATVLRTLLAEQA